MVLHHSGGETDEILLDHTMTSEQIAWFRAGSALNKIKESNG
jgi:aconitate hydratase